MHGESTIPTWTIRSTLVAVADLDRSVAFYREIGPFEEIFREDAVAVLGEMSPASISLILRETRGSGHTRNYQQSLGLRSIHFNVGLLGELDRLESELRGRDLFTSRSQIGDGASELLIGRDPDNLPLVFLYYTKNKWLNANYYRAVADRAYSLDV
jgi:hypothetical protein